MLSFELNQKLLNKIKELSYKMARKQQFLQALPPEATEAMHQFARVSQIGASTRIENAILTDAEIEWIDTTLSQDGKTTSFLEKKELIENKLSKDRERSIEEVAGCRNMLLLIYSQHADFFPLTESLLRGLHHELLKYYPRASHYLGKYKTVPNSVIARNAKTKEERIVFKTADAGPITEVAVAELLRWYDETLPSFSWSMAVAAEFTFRFLAIHPFQDGNGRLGRGLFLLALLQSPDKVVSTLARYLAVDRQIEKHKEEYYFVLQQCSQGIFQQDPKKYAMEHFCNYMLKIVDLALDDIDYYFSRYESVQRLSESALQVLQCFKDYPEKRLQIKDLVELTALPRRTLNYAIEGLLQNSLLQKCGQGRATRYQIIF